MATSYYIEANLSPKVSTVSEKGHAWITFFADVCRQRLSCVVYTPGVAKFSNFSDFENLMFIDVFWL